MSLKTSFGLFAGLLAVLAIVVNFVVYGGLIVLAAWAVGKFILS